MDELMWQVSFWCEPDGIVGQPRVEIVHAPEPLTALTEAGILALVPDDVVVLVEIERKE